MVYALFTLEFTYYFYLFICSLLPAWQQFPSPLFFFTELHSIKFYGASKNISDLMNINTLLTHSFKPHFN